MKNYRFDLGRVVGTPGALAAMEEAGVEGLDVAPALWPALLAAREAIEKALGE